jgi:coenzyme F420-0:L-glutamate ligase / coenzyme F420-1:gamma-L-glutamate ligase
VNIEMRSVDGLPEIRPGDDLGALITGRAGPLHDGSVIVVAQKVVSKAEGRLRDLGTVAVTQRAETLGRALHADPRMVQVVLDESVSVLRAERVLIVETRHGFVCANAGVDRSNIADADTVSLLPDDCDASAMRLHRRISGIAGAHVAVVVSDTFGRAWRTGLCNVALGVAGMPAMLDHRGQDDDFGRPLAATQVALADELAAAAELVMGKTRRVPAVVITGIERTVCEGGGTGRELLRPHELDLFR